MRKVNLLQRSYNIKTVRSFLLIAISIIYLISRFSYWESANILVSLICLVTLIIYFPYVNGVPRITSVILIIFGIILFRTVHVDLLTGFLAFGENANILTLFILVPLIGIPISVGNYLKHVEILYTYYTRNKNQFYLLSAIFTHLLSIVLNLGAIPLIYQLLNSGKNSAMQTTLIKSLTRGYMISTFWSPFFISVALVISYIKVPWIKLFPVGFFVSLVCLYIGYLVEKHIDNNQTDVSKKAEHYSYGILKESWGKVRELLFSLLFITILIIIIETMTDYNVITIVSVIAILSPLVWTFFLGKQHLLVIELKNYIFVVLPRMKGEVCLFISAGVFANAVLFTNLSNYVVYTLQALNMDNLIFLSFFLITTSTVFSIVGVHPIVTVTTFCVSLSGQDILVGKELTISMILISCWAISVTISPFSGLNLLAGSLTNQSSITSSVKNNWLYVLLVALTIIVLLNVIHWVFGI
jgi:DcuC family C4-dicarboxylate transporter